MPTVRAYTNYLDDPDGNFWMVDTVDKGTSVAVKGIQIVNASGVAVVDDTKRLADTRIADEPKAWLQFERAEVAVVKGIAIISKPSGGASIASDPIKAKVALAVSKAKVPSTDGDAYDELVTKRVDEMMQETFMAAVNKHARRLVEAATKAATVDATVPVKEKGAGTQ